MTTNKADIPNLVGFPIKILFKDGFMVDIEVSKDSSGCHHIQYCEDNLDRPYSNVEAWDGLIKIPSVLFFRLDFYLEFVNSP